MRTFFIRIYSGRQNYSPTDTILLYFLSHSKSNNSKEVSFPLLYEAWYLVYMYVSSASDLLLYVNYLSFTTITVFFTVSKLFTQAAMNPYIHFLIGCIEVFRLSTVIYSVKQYNLSEIFQMISMENILLWWLYPSWVTLYSLGE
jgi:hypothetical protein